MAKAAAAEVEELPRAIVRRVVKDKLSQSSNEGEIIVHKEALLAFSESARIFIHYLSATANDICKESKRQTINADDVLKALEEIEFPEFIGPLKASLDDLRQKNAGKKAVAAKAKEADKKRKMEEEPSEQNGDGGGGEDEKEEANEDEDDTPDNGDGEDEKEEANEDEDHTPDNGDGEDEKEEANEDEDHTPDND